MKTAVIFYSYDGNCAFVAEQIKTHLDADLVRLQIKDDKRRGGLTKFFWGGSMVLMSAAPELKPYSFDPAEYDLLILGVPVWAGNPAPPIRSFLSETKISGKKIALFVCHAGGKGKSLEKFKAMMAGNDIIADTDFRNPSKETGEEQKRQIADWIKTFSA